MKSKNAHIELLGKTVKDRVSGMTGTVTSVSFDLFGCIQAAVSPPVDKDGKLPDGRWMDVNRLEVLNEKRCMPVPEFSKSPEVHAYGPADKPAR